MEKERQLMYIQISTNMMLYQMLDFAMKLFLQL